MAENPSESQARKAGRGGLLIALAKVSFIAFGFAQQLVLPRILGSEGYGALSTILSVVSIVNNVIVAIGIQGVSRAVAAADDDTWGAVFRKTLEVHAALALGTAVGLALLADVIARAFYVDHLSSPLRLVAIIVLMYGVYAPLVGGLNGRGRFKEQALLDIGYGAMRAVLIVVVAYLGAKMWDDGVLGACLGFVITAVLIVPIAIWRSGIGHRGKGAPTAREHSRYLAPLALGLIALNLLMQADFLVIRRVLGTAAETLGKGPEAADDLIGVYRGVKLFSFLPYQLLMSVTFVLFPMLAKARATGDGDGVRRFTVTGIRIAFIVTGLVAGTIAALAPWVLRFAFPPEIADRGPMSLRILALGTGAFAIFGVSCAALTSLGRERIAAGLNWLAVLLVAIGCFALVPTATFGPDMLVAGSWATAGSLTVAAVCGAVALHRTAGGFVPWPTLIRVAIAVAASMAVGTFMPYWGRLLVVVQAILVALVYVVVLVATRELGSPDLTMLKAIVRRKPATAT